MRFVPRPAAPVVEWWWKSGGWWVTPPRPMRHLPGMTKTKREAWPGGYIYQSRGKSIYVIRRMVAGVRYEVSTRCTTLRAAISELERWEKDPAGYVPGGRQHEAIYLDTSLVTEYLAWCGDNSERWLKSKRGHLAWWAKQLRRVNLRKATLRDHILPALKETPQRNQRIATIKHLYAYLREHDRIEAAEDPCLDKLRADPPKPAQHEASKVITPEQYQAARAHMDGTYRDALDLLAGTGWHVTEAVRFAESGEMEPYEGKDAEGHAVLTVYHKSGAMHRTVVTEEVAAAAARLRAAGRLSESMLGKRLKAACEAAKIEPFKAGWFRHTIATMAWDSGHAGQVPAFLGHRSSETTKKFYATRAIPPRVPTLR